MWSRALATDGGGTSGGVAILSPERIQITEPPLVARGQLASARAVAGRVHSVVRGGFIAVPMYLHAGDQMGAANTAPLAEVGQYCAQMSELGWDW
eukprot:285857-Pyramimonas_sp.AAC.1